MKTSIRARLHELRCAECRVTWPRWVARIVTEPAQILRRRLVDRLHDCRCACADDGNCGPCARSGR